MGIIKVLQQTGINPLPNGNRSCYGMIQKDRVLGDFLFSFGKDC